MQRDLHMSIQIQGNKLNQQEIKRKEIEDNVIYLQEFLTQANEEQMMTAEDIDAKNIKKAELVAQREELDQMYESGKQAAGKEFEIFMKLQ